MKHFLLATLACSVVAVTASADWAQYLGPNRNAVAADADLGLLAAVGNSGRFHLGRGMVAQASRAESRPHSQPKRYSALHRFCNWQRKVELLVSGDWKALVSRIAVCSHCG
jgi:hypothetical protein